MGSWRHHVGALFGRRSALREATGDPRRVGLPLSVSSIAADAAANEPAVEDASDAPIDLRYRLFDWVTGDASAPAAPLRQGEHRLLAHLDAVLAADDSCAMLLPRAPAVIPQLLNSLRNDSQSATVLAQRVMRDPHLVAEVIRIANSVHARADQPVADIAEAIGRIGTDGIRRAISRVVLKPMFNGTGDTLSARCAQRLWQHSEAQAVACQIEAATRGLDPFEGYLAGLMHNVGWSAALRALDRGTAGLPAQSSHAFVAAFEQRREAFFATLAGPWQLTQGLTALCTAVLQDDLTLAPSPLADALRAAEQRASMEVLDVR